MQAYYANKPYTADSIEEGDILPKDCIDASINDCEGYTSIDFLSEAFAKSC